MAKKKGRKKALHELADSLNAIVNKAYVDDGLSCVDIIGVLDTQKLMVFDVAREDMLGELGGDQGAH